MPITELVVKASIGYIDRFGLQDGTGTVTVGTVGQVHQGVVFVKEE